MSCVYAGPTIRCRSKIPPGTKKEKKEGCKVFRSLEAVRDVYELSACCSGLTGACLSRLNLICTFKIGEWNLERNRGRNRSLLSSQVAMTWLEGEGLHPVIIQMLFSGQAVNRSCSLIHGRFHVDHHFPFWRWSFHQGPKTDIQSHRSTDTFLYSWSPSVLSESSCGE